MHIHIGTELLLLGVNQLGRAVLHGDVRYFVVLVWEELAVLPRAVVLRVVLAGWIYLLAVEKLGEGEQDVAAPAARRHCHGLSLCRVVVADQVATSQDAVLVFDVDEAVYRLLEGLRLAHFLHISGVNDLTFVEQGVEGQAAVFTLFDLVLYYCFLLNLEGCTHFLNLKNGLI